MNRKQRLLLVTSMIIGVFCCMPLVIGATSVPFEAPAGSYTVGAVFLPGLYETNTQITFTANGTIDLFVTNDTNDRDLYLITGIVPSTPTIVANSTGTSGSICINFPTTDDTYYLYFGNKNNAFPVGGTYEVGSCGIPGFAFLFIFFALLAAFGILWSKKKLNF